MQKIDPAEIGADLIDLHYNFDSSVETRTRTMISDLPRDLSERVLCRLPVTSLRGVRLTCKKWNTLSKDQTFTEWHIAAAKNKQRKEFQVVMMLNFEVFLFNVNLTDLLNPSIERLGKLTTLTDDIEISEIFHCDGLLLCVTKDKSSLVVWNPCSGETRWIEPPRNSHYDILDRYALGYEKKKDKYSHKVLRFVDDYDPRVKRRVSKFEIYSLDSDSWKVVDDVNDPDWEIESHHRGLSLKGNTYWYAQEKHDPPGPDFLICFDFTNERFGPRLFLPFRAFSVETATLSSVRETQLAVLCQKCTSLVYNVKIWITSEIEPNAVSWTNLFLSVDMKPIVGFRFLFGSFFVDENKRVAVVLDKDRAKGGSTRYMAYIIGNNGYVKRVDLGESSDLNCWPLVCSFVPSSVQIKQPP